MRSRPLPCRLPDGSTGLPQDGWMRDFWDSECYKQLLEGAPTYTSACPHVIGGVAPLCALSCASAEWCQRQYCQLTRRADPFPNACAVSYFADDPDFAKDPRHAILFLTADGVMVFKKDARGKKGYSVWPIAMGVMNLPPSLRSLPATTHLVGLAPGPAPKQLQSYLAPLASELAYLGKKGTLVSDAAWRPGDELPQRFRVKAKLVIVTADLRAATKLEPNPSAPAKEGACLHCDQPGASSLEKNARIRPEPSRVSLCLQACPVLFSFLRSVLADDMASPEKH